MEKYVSRKSVLSHSFDYTKKPVLIVKENEYFTVETEDCCNGIIKSEKDSLTVENFRPYSNFVPNKGNPLTGPIYVEGIERGDLLEITIKEIIPDSYGFIAISQQGPLSNYCKWPELGESYTKIIKHEPGQSGTLKDGKCIYNDEIQWDLKPLIGTIGVCADYEIFSSADGQFPSGGNWDCRDIKEGSKLYLNCYHKGGLLYLGDVHGSQGDAEWSTSGNEMKAKVTLSCKIIKNKKIPYARIDKGDSIVQLFCDKPLENAVKRAIIHLMEWVSEDYNIKPKDTYAIFSGSPDFKINIYQMADMPGVKFTAGAEFSKKYFK